MALDSVQSTSIAAMAGKMFEWAASTSVVNMTDGQVEMLCSIQNDSYHLQHHHHSNETVETSFIHMKTPSYLVWTVGLLFVTVINMCAVVGIGVMRYLSKSVYNQVITFFVGLGVGSLSGSSLYHLLPQAHPILLEQRDEKGELTHEYLTTAHWSLIGVYSFFLADKLIKVILQGRKTNGGTELEMVTVEDSACKSMGDQPLLHSVASNFSVSSFFYSIPPVLSPCDEEEEVEAHGICSHDHQMEFTAGDSAIAAVAWMIVFGDGLHNLIDGISIGASFSDSLHSGLSVSLAVLAEEFPHELGDVAILVASGLTLRQALLYNLLSALTCYVGFFLGVAIGDLNPDNAKYLFALAGGMFLYISLSCMMPEMKKAMEEALYISIYKGLYVFVLQASGLFCGLTLMFTMARYGGDISI